MATALDRRLQKLEATAKSAGGEGRPRLVLVQVGGSAEEAIAKLDDRRPDDFLMVVQLVAPSDVQVTRTLQ